MPIENADVELPPAYRGGESQQTTDAAGVATFPKLSQETWEIKARVKGYALVSQELVVSGSTDTEVKISLSQPGADLFGVVKDSEGNPVAKAQVYAAPNEERADLRAFHAWATADEKGQYRIHSLPINKTLETRVFKEGFAEYESTVVLNVEAAGEQRLNFAISKRPETIIEGTVTDSDGISIAGAAIFSINARSEIKCKSDENGKYKLVGKFERGELGFEAKGYERKKVEINLVKRRHEVDAKLKPGRNFSGKVVDTQDNPIAGVKVGATIFPDRHFISDHQCKTDKEGRYELDSLPGDTEISFSKDGFSSVTIKQVPEGPELETTVLLPEGVIRANVADKSTGKPITRFRAYYTWSNARMPEDPGRRSMSMASHLGDLFSNPQGQFELKKLQHGAPLEVTVEADGYQKCTIARIVAHSSEATESATFEMVPLDPMKLLTVAGKIVDVEGSVVVGVEVRLIGSDERFDDPKTHPHGRGRNAFPFNWEMIFSRQIAEDSRVLQYHETTTDVAGKFSFSNVQSTRDIEIVYWSDNVVRSRHPQIENLSSTEQQSLTIIAPRCGTVRGALDWKANPGASPTIVVGEERFYNLNSVRDDPMAYEIAGVPLGKHEVLIYGNPKPVKIPSSDQEHFMTSIIKRIPVEVRPGEVARADVLDVLEAIKSEKY